MRVLAAGFGRWRLSEKPAAEGELGGPLAVGEEAVIADAVEVVGQGVKEKAPDEFAGGEVISLGRAGWR